MLKFDVREILHILHDKLVLASQIRNPPTQHMGRSSLLSNESDPPREASFDRPRDPPREHPREPPFDPPRDHLRDPSFDHLVTLRLTLLATLRLTLLVTLILFLLPEIARTTFHNTIN
ncbi:hypothetical protein HanPSC8_Chr17g0798651 [Helianthus annuus]|nr:hypothetical protein HanPSC8_Chr17g0798651 [Helianthus annuus]